jgi:hypothetical protein
VGRDELMQAIIEAALVIAAAALIGALMAEPLYHAVDENLKRYEVKPWTR